MDSFIIQALIGGILLAIMTGPLGCVLVWKKMAFFGEALSHGALLGVALGIFFKVHLFIGVIATSVILSALMIVIRKYSRLSNDSMLGILAHSFLAIGLLVFSLLNEGNLNITSYLFGDILSINRQDIIIIALIMVVTLFILRIIWQRLLLLTFHEELAMAEGVNVDKIRFIFMLLIAFTIAIAMQYVGILLTTSLLIIPASTAYRFASSPERMAVLANVIGGVSVAGGIYGSVLWDIPTGAAIVVSALILFMVSNLLPQKALG